MADVVFSVGLGNIPPADIQRVRRQAEQVAQAQETQRRGRRAAEAETARSATRQAQAEQRGFQQRLQAQRQFQSRVVNQQLRASRQREQQAERTAQQQVRAEQRSFQQRIAAQRQFQARVAREQLRGSQRQIRQAEQQQQRLLAVSRGLVATAGFAGFGLAVTNAVRTLATFEQAMSTVRAISGATEEQFVSLREEAQRLGATTRFTATQAAEGLVFLSRAGFDAEQSLAAIEGTLLLAQAGALELGTAADIATNVLTGFRLEVGELGRVVDVLALAANSSNQSVEQLGQAMSFIAPISQSLGVSVEETAAALGTLANAGIQGERGGTGLRRVLLALLDPTTNAREAIERLGISLDELNVQQVGIQGVFARFAEAGATIEDFAQIFGTRGAGIANILVQTTDGFARLTDVLENAQGSAQEIATVMDQNLHGAILRVGAAYEALIMAFGDLGPTSALTQFLNQTALDLRFVAQNMDEVVEAFLTLSPGVLLGITEASVAADEAADTTRNYAEEIRVLELMAAAAFGATREALEAEIAELRALQAASMDTTDAVEDTTDAVMDQVMALEDNTDAKQDNAEATREQQRAARAEQQRINENIRALNAEARAEQQQQNARLRRVRAEEAASRQRQETLELSRREIAVLEEANAAGLTYEQTQQRLLDVGREYALERLEYLRSSQQITEQTYEEERAIIEAEAAYEMLSGGLQRARTATDDLHDSLRRVIEQFILGTGSIGDFTNALLRIGSTAVSDAILGAAFGPGGAQGGNLLGQLLGGGAGGGGFGFGGGGLIAGAGRFLSGSAGSAVSATVGRGGLITSIGVGPPAPTGLLGSGLSFGGLGLLGGGLLGGLLGGRAFGPLGSLVGSGAGAAVAGGVGGLLGGGTFSGGAAGAFGLSGAGASALLGPAALAGLGIFGAVSIFDLFNQPGRIQIEKESLSEFLNSVFADEDFSEFDSSRVRGAITGTPEEWQQAGRSLGIVWAEGYEDATQGTAKRFLNQFLTELVTEGRSPTEIEAAFGMLFSGLGGAEGILTAANQATRTFSDEQGNMLLSLQETAEELDEMREKLARFGDTSSLTLRELNAFAEANNRVNEEIVSYNDIVAGAIILNSEFNDSLDATTSANRLIADRFAEVADGSMVATDQLGALEAQLRDGTLTIEEAAIAFNMLRAGVGEAALALSDFTIDPSVVAEQIELDVASLIDVNAFRLQLAEALTASVQTGVAIDFEQAIRVSIAEALFRGLIGSVVQLATSGFIDQFVGEINALISQNVAGEITLDELFAGTDEVLARFQPDIDAMNARLMETTDVVHTIAEAFGIVSEEVMEVMEAVEESASSMERYLEQAQAVDEVFGILLNRATQLEQIGAITSEEGAQQRRDIAARAAGAATFEAGLTFGGEGSDELLARANQRLEELAAAEIRLYDLRARAIEEESQATIQAERDLSQVRQNALQEERQGLQSQLQIAQSFQQALNTIEGNITALVTGPGSPLSQFEQAEFFQQQATDLRGRLRTAAPEDQAGIATQLSQTLNQIVSTGPFRIGDARRDMLFRDILEEQEQLARFAEARVEDVDRIEAALADNQVASAAETALLTETIQQLEAVAAERLLALRTQTVDTLNTIWAQQNELDRRRNELLEALAEERTRPQSQRGSTDDPFGILDLGGFNPRTAPNYDPIAALADARARALAPPPRSRARNIDLTVNVQMSSTGANLAQDRANARRTGQQIGAAVMDEVERQST